MFARTWFWYFEFRKFSEDSPCRNDDLVYYSREIFQLLEFIFDLAKKLFNLFK